MSSGLAALVKSAVSEFDSCEYLEHENADIRLTFANGTKLRASYWRLIKAGGQNLSSFDHGQIYGLPAHIDAKKQLWDELRGKEVISANLEAKTGDLIFEISNMLELQILNFTGYEVWEISFPNGSTEYSNHNVPML
ncbi:MAG: hypothetical protein Q8L53_09435 [Aestuariivirga sp.]|nr:hypothetical protein [Aestuariivirga sp.]